MDHRKEKARKELKPRGSTLFPVPSREAVYKETYEEQKKKETEKYDIIRLRNYLDIQKNIFDKAA